MGQLLAVSKKHHGHGVKVVTVADLAEFEDAFNPTGDEENVNPNSVIAGRKGVIVSDAGANDLLLVKRHGRIKVLATFPNRTVGADTFDEVPTSVQRGPGRRAVRRAADGLPVHPRAPPTSTGSASTATSRSSRPASPTSSTSRSTSGAGSTSWRSSRTACSPATRPAR